MRVIPLSDGAEVRLLASIEELPMERHVLFQQQMILASGVGSTVEDIENHFRQLYTLLAAGRTEDAAEEVAHLFGTYAFALAGTDLDLLTLCCLIVQIGEEMTNDLTPDGLARTAARLRAGGLTVGQLREELASVKKNFARS